MLRQCRIRGRLTPLTETRDETKDTFDIRRRRPRGRGPRRHRAGPIGADLPVRADHPDRGLAGRRRQRHQHAAPRRCAEQAAQGSGRGAQQAGRGRLDRPPRNRQRQAGRLHHRHVQLRRHRAALPERTGQHDRGLSAARLLRRGSERDRGQHRRAASIRSRNMSNARRPTPARSRTATTSRAARPTSASRCSRSSSASRSRASRIPDMAQP